MCTRYTIASNVAAIEHELQAEFQYTYEKVYNAHAGLSLPVILSGAEDEIVALKWGLIPYWSANPYQGGHHINAPARSIVKSPTCRMPVRTKRCLILANCFFIWVRLEHGKKIPYLVYDAKQRIMTFAGIWDEWKDREEGTCLQTFSIITTHANKRLRSYVKQMPVIIPPGRRRKYLRSSIHLNEVMRMLHPQESDSMNAYPVAGLVNDFHANSREVLDPVGERVFKEYTYVPRVYLKLEGMGSMKDNPDRNPEIKLMI